MKEIIGGVCAAQGFRAAGVHCGIRKNKEKKDLALVVSDCVASAAAVYTQNLVKGAPIAVTKSHLSNGRAQAMLCNSGNANTCNADGEQVANDMCTYLEQQTGIPAADVIIASTGVIGQPLDLKAIQSGMAPLVAALHTGGATDAAQAIMTTDTFAKETAVEFELGGAVCRMGGMAKGSGMIHPNMATLLVFLTTDAAISPAMLRQALAEDVADSFNMVSVDGDTSTNDMMSIMANGLAGNVPIVAEGTDYQIFKTALAAVTAQLCRMIAKDGEGATKLLECQVFGAADPATARAVARGIISSSLFKAAMYGADANWGRALCAIGYCGAAVDITKIDMAFRSVNGDIAVCSGGAGLAFSEEQAKQILDADEIIIEIHLNAGGAAATAWGCDLTRQYVEINSDYRS